MSIADITPELLNEVAQTFIDEDAEHIIPTWWKVLSKASMEACDGENPRKPEMVSPHAATIISAIEQVKANGPSTQAIGGIVLKAMVMGWRMAEMHLTKGTDGVVQ